MTAETVPPDATRPDPHTTAGKLAGLEVRRSEALMRRKKAVDQQHAKGKQTAMERIEALLDEGSFSELDGLARHRSHAFGMEQTRPYGDGVVTGYGTSTAARYACSRRTSPSSAAASARSSARRSSR